MYVKEYMSAPVVTTDPEAPIYDAQKLMRDHGIRRLPVVDKTGKLMGLVTQDRLRDISPSPATSLSIWELHYLLTKIKVKDAMVQEVVTVSPDTPIEEAARIGQQKKIGTLPVVDKGKLVGIITTTDLFKILTQVLGFGEAGYRLHLYGCGRGTKELNQVLDIIKRHGVGIRAMFAVRPPGVGQEDTIIHLDATDVSALVAEVRALGCQVDSRAR